MLVYLEGFDIFLNLNYIVSISIKEIDDKDWIYELQYTTVTGDTHRMLKQLSSSQHSTNLNKLKHSNDK